MKSKTVKMQWQYGTKKSLTINRNQKSRLNVLIAAVLTIKIYCDKKKDNSGKGEKSVRKEFVLFNAIDETDDDKENDAEINEVFSRGDLSADFESLESESNELVSHSTLVTKSQNDDSWFVDSGATRHMTPMNMDLKKKRKPTVGNVHTKQFFLMLRNFLFCIGNKTVFSQFI